MTIRNDLVFVNLFQGKKKVHVIKLMCNTIFKAGTTSLLNYYDIRTTFVVWHRGTTYLINV